MGKRFIHRLHVLNPLSNLDIIGDVLYFVIKGETNVNSDVHEKISSDVNLKIDISIKDDLSHPQPSPTLLTINPKQMGSWTLGGPIASPLVETSDNTFAQPEGKELMNTGKKEFKSTHE